MNNSQNSLPISNHPELGSPEVIARIMDSLNDSDSSLFVSRAKEADDGTWAGVMSYGIVDPDDLSPDQQAVTF